MISCKRCFSYAINHHSHGRDGTEKELEKANNRIKRLEEIINRASLAFFSDASHRKVSIAMHTILEEFRRETKS